MKKLSGAVLAALMAFGCQEIQEPPNTPHWLPWGEEDQQGVAEMVVWFKHHGEELRKAGDDDSPTITCENQGPSTCKRSQEGVWFCMDPCGSAFWHVDLVDISYCIDAMTGRLRNCQ